MTKISFIVTCYNEEKHVIGAIEKVHQAATQLGYTHDIIVIDDASQDGTSRVVKEFMQHHPDISITLLRNPSNKGVAHNFVEGVFHAQGEYCRLICGDNIESMETHLTILKEIGKSDMIVPAYIVIIGRTWFRHFISRSFTRIVNLISGYQLKYYNGCPIFKRHDVMRWHVEATGLGYQAELIIRLLRQGKTYHEVWVQGFDREGSVSFRMRNILSVLHSILKISISRLRASVLK